MGIAEQEEEEDKRVRHGIFLLSIICLVAEKTKGKEGRNFVFYVLDFEQRNYLPFRCEQTMEKKMSFLYRRWTLPSHIFSTTKQ